MATNTTKLGLIKPDFVDVVDITDLNDNANLIDAAVGMTICTSATRPASPWSGQIIFETDTLIPYVWDGSAWQVAGGGGGGVTVSSTAPSSPSEGDLWWDSDDGKLFVYYNDGTSSQWVDAAGPSVAVQSTAPTGYEGQLWLDDTDGSMYVYYTDPGGGSSSWIGAVSRSGGILQVVSTTKTDTFSASVTSGATTSITGLTATITPRSTSSKIYAVVSTNALNLVAGTSGAHVILTRDGTPVGGGDSAGSRTPVNVFGGQSHLSGTDGTGTNQTFNYLDSPSTTSSVTYGVDLLNVSGSTCTLLLNRTIADSDNTYIGRASSTITLIEVAG